MLTTHLRPRVLHLLSADTAGAGGGSSAPAAPEKPATLGEQLRAAIASRVTLQRELDAARAEAADLGGTITTLTADLTTARADLAAAQSQVTTLTADLTAARADLAAAQAANQTISDGVVETVASLGFPADKLPATAPEGGANTADELHREMAAITDPQARAAFYLKHKAQLLG